MKRILLAGLATELLLFGAGGIANADLFVYDDDSNFISIGGYDTWIASTTPNWLPGNGNNPENELEWINSALHLTGQYAFTLADFEKTENPDPDNTDSNWNGLWKSVYTESSSLANPEGWAFELTNRPDYFMVKTGTNGTDPDYRYFLFQNDVNYDWAAFQLVVPTQYTILGVGKLSHIDQVGGSTPVPEPATMLLFGTGLVGLAGLARRKAK